MNTQPLSSEMELTGTPLSVPSVDDVVYTELRALIVRNTLPAGSVLKLRDLAERLGTSTTPVRAALDRLSLEGLCVQSPRRGARVAPMTLADLKEIQTIRLGLGAEACRIAVPLLTASELTHIETMWEQALERWSERGTDIDDYVEVSERAFRLIYQNLGYKRLCGLIESYQRQAERYLRFALREGSDLERDVPRFTKFVQAILQQDVEQAVVTLRSLLDLTVALVEPELKD